MAEKCIFSAIATVGSKISDLTIKNGQLIFVRDKRTIALDFDGKRTFYNQIEELATEQDRLSLLAPVSGIYYFVVDKAVLWTYREGWVQITTPPDEILFIGTEFPEFGCANRLYIDSESGRIAIWDEKSGSYIVVADKTTEMSADDVDALFGK